MPEPEIPGRADRKLLLRTATRLLDSREAGEDAVQQACLRLLERAQRCEPPPDEPIAWLARVSRNVAIDELRRRRVERDAGHRDSTEATEAIDSNPSPDDELERRQRCREALRVLMDGSSPEDAAAVLLRHVFGVDYAIIASCSGRSEAAWRQRVSRALHRTRTQREKTLPLEAGSRHHDADAVLNRFVHAVLDTDPVALFAVLRSTPPRAVAPSGSTARTPRPDAVSHLSFQFGEHGLRVWLTLGGMPLCDLTANRPDGVEKRAPGTPCAARPTPVRRDVALQSLPPT